MLRNRLNVPPNQREYSWEEEHVQDLFQDLAGAIDSGKSSYFLDTIVLTPGSEEAFEVADGQQRLATTTILLAVIRDYFQDRNENLLVQDLNQFLYTVVRETREIQPRLRLNIDDNEFFKNRILSKRGDALRRSARPTKPSHDRIIAAARMAEELILRIIAPHNDQNRIERLNQWVGYLEKSALVIVLKVPDDLNAYVMFETLNDRGLRTSQADLAKNHLFNLADDRLVEAQQRWAAMNGALDTLEENDVTITYLRHLLISLWGHTREREVFDKVKEHVIAKQHSIEFLDALANNANDYVAIQTPTHSKWNDYAPNIRKHVRTMAFLQLTPLRPLMLAVSSSFSKRQMELAFRQFVCWSVRFLVSGGARSGRMEEAVARAAQEVSNGRIDTAQKLTNQLQDVLPTDPIFEAKFATETVAKNALARYYLRALERKLQNDPSPEWVPNEDTVITLEHVLPQNPSEQWTDIDPALMAAYYRRIGNMVLLRAGLNNNIGNKTFAEKKPVIAESTFVLTQEVAKYDTWGPVEIEERQKKLAKIALETWPL